MRWITLITLLFIIGCTPTYECPIVTCPLCEIEELEIEENITRYEIDGGTPIYLIVGDLTVDIVNCGDIAHGLVVVDEIRHITAENDLGVRNLIVNNTYSKYIGGCKDILIEFPEIQKVQIKDIERDTDEYKEFIRWIPSYKIEKFI